MLRPVALPVRRLAARHRQPDQARPDDLELFVEGIVTYHMVTEGVLAMPGQRIMIEYTEDHDLYPGFNQGFRLVEQDEHRHIAFGVRFLKDVCEERPEMKRGRPAAPRGAAAEGRRGLLPAGGR